MARGNDGNYLQHCVEVAAAVRLARASLDNRLRVALTHGMAPFEQIDESKGNAHCLLYGALREAAGKPKRNERDVAKAYRASWKSQAYRPDIANLFDELKKRKHYPNSAELLRAVTGTSRLSGGITERDEAKHKELAKAWAGSGIVVARSSWRRQLDPDGALGCPDYLDIPWLFSMDPMTYTENGDSDDGNLHRSDLKLLAPALARYIASGQPGIASLFVYSVGSQGKNAQCQFWAFMDELAGRLGIPTHSRWVAHRGGNRNLVGLLLSDEKLAEGFDLPSIESGRGKKCLHPSTHDIAPKITGTETPLNEVEMRGKSRVAVSSSGAEDARSVFDSDSLTSVAGLRSQGFDGFVTVADLRLQSRNDIPALPGVYLVLRDCASYPEFLDVGTGGHFKNKDPNVPVSRLKDEWVDGAVAIYIGQTGSRSKGTLKKRIGELIRFGQGSLVGHRGGRLIWQLRAADRLLVCWKEVVDDDPRKFEKELIEAFKSAHGGRRPFANLRD